MSCMIDSATGTNGEEPPGVVMGWFLSVNLLLSPFFIYIAQPAQLVPAAITTG